MIESLRFDTPNGMIGVDSEANVIRGFVVAATGVFKSGRGEFDSASLKQAYKLIKSESGGIRSRFGHPSPSSDGLGKFLGMVQNPTIDKQANGTELLRADLHLDETALTMAPMGGTPLGQYVMALAKSNPKAFATSLQLTTDREYRLDSKGRPKLDSTGQPLPPLWRPTQLLASDVVDVGDATPSFLSANTIDVRREAAKRKLWWLKRLTNSG